MKLTKKQNESLNELKQKWNESGKGIILNKKNSLILNNLRRSGFVEIYPAHSPMKGFYQSWEAFPSKVLR